MARSTKSYSFSRYMGLGILTLLCTVSGSKLSADNKPSKPAAPAPKAAAAPKAPAGGAAGHTPGAGAAGHTPGAAGAHTPGAAGGGMHPGGANTGGMHPGGANTGGMHPGGANTGAMHPGGNTAGMHPGGNAPGVHPGGNAPGMRPGAAGPGARPGGPGARPGPGGREFGRNAGHPVGRPGSVRSPVMHGEHAAYRGPMGHRAYERRLPDGRRVFADGRGRGYIHHEYVYGGRRVYQRVYYVNGVAYPRYYNPYVFGGVELAVYAPTRYWAPAFYGYVYNPWAVPVNYAWGFAAAPWYGYYGGYFTPYPVYASPSLWLTDYMISRSLEDAYQAQQDAANAAAAAQAQSFAAPMTPDVKAQIAKEVKRQIALENSERQTAQTSMPDPASSGVARMFQDNMTHVFVVVMPLNATTAAGECPVTQGDVLQLTPGQSVTAEQLANVIVLASKGQDCSKGSMVAVGVSDLQDMQNAMRQNIDQGLASLQENQGKNGLPALPASVAGPAMDAGYAKNAPPPPADGAQQVAQEWQAGNTAEQAPPDNAVAGQTGPAPAQPAPPPAAAPEPKQLGMGMTVDEVEQAAGKPTTVLNVGKKKIYVYREYKVTFTDGKVSDIQ